MCMCVLKCVQWCKKRYFKVLLILVKECDCVDKVVKQKKVVKKSPLRRRIRMMKQEITTYKIDKYKKEDCTDESDPITLEDFLEDQDIIYFKAGSKNHCFELQNFAGMLLDDRKNNKISKSPITREPISDGVRNMIIEAVYTEDLSDVILTQRFLNAIENEDEIELNQIILVLL